MSDNNLACEFFTECLLSAYTFRLDIFECDLYKPRMRIELVRKKADTDCSISAK